MSIAVVGTFISGTTIASLTACSPSAEGRHEALMDKIDGDLVLPAKANALREYARYYAQRPDGKIAIFLTAYTYQEPSTADGGCFEMLLNLSSREVPCDPNTEPRAGEHQWIAIERMPEASDGGCSIVEAVYDPSAERIVSLQCNGPG